MVRPRTRTLMGRRLRAGQVRNFILPLDRLVQPITRTPAYHLHFLPKFSFQYSPWLILAFLRISH